MLSFLVLHTSDARNAFVVQGQMACSSVSAPQALHMCNTERPANTKYKRHRQITSKDTNTAIAPSNIPHNATNCRKRPRFVQGMYNNITQISVTISISVPAFA